MRLAAWLAFDALAPDLTCDRQYALSRESHARDTAVDTPLHVFQVEAPVRQSYDEALHDFTESYGTNFMGTYSPPADRKFTNVVFNMTITSAGINYDRLTLLYLRDTDVWRSSTAMPVRTGIYYSFVKGMTAYASLLHQEQKVIMQIDNIFNAVFTGNFNVAVTALFYNEAGAVQPADVILPVSTRSSAHIKTSTLIFPDDGDASVSLTFPPNVERALVSVFASGNGNEEFWYADAAGQYVSTFTGHKFRGFGPWRDVQVLIDGQLAGVIWPFPVVFALGTVASNWPVSAGVFLWLDEAGTQTMGGHLSYTNIQNNTASAKTLWQSTNVSTKFSPSSLQGTTDTTTSSFEYALYFFQAYNIASHATAANSTVVAVLDRSKSTHGETVLTQLTYPSTVADATATAPLLRIRQNGTSLYLWNNSYYEDARPIDPAIGTPGATDQWFSWTGISGSADGRESGEYGRFVSAVDRYEPVLKVDLERDSLIDVPDTNVVTGPAVNAL